MPRAKVKLYVYPWKVQLTLGNHGVENYNMPFGEADFRVYKGSTTNIDFEIKDVDRKPVSAIGKNAIITILDHENRFEVLTKDLEVINDLKGKLQLQLTPTDVNSLDDGWYDYVVLLENEDGTQNVLYTDQTMTARGYFEIIGDMLPPNVMSMDFGDPMTDWLASTNADTLITTYYSAPELGDASIGDEWGLHTAAIYLTDYSGTIKIQGSLESTAPSDNAQWFDISITPNTFEAVFENVSGIQAYNFEANVTWVRFCRVDATLNTGTVDKVLLKL